MDNRKKRRKNVSCSKHPGQKGLPGPGTGFDLVHCPIMDDRTLRENCKIRQSLNIDKKSCAGCKHCIDT